MFVCDTDKLSCGSHKCEEPCHRGKCPPCWQVSFDELRCECGAEVIYPPVPCGTVPPPCSRPCIRPHPCGHNVCWKLSLSPCNCNNNTTGLIRLLCCNVTDCNYPGKATLLLWGALPEIYMQCWVRCLTWIICISRQTNVSLLALSRHDI